MPVLRPLEHSDLDAAASLMVRPDVGPYLGLNRFARSFEIRTRLEGKTALGLFRGGELRACAVLDPSPRHRSKHLAEVTLFCGPESVADAGVLCRHVIDAAEQWLALFKLEISIDPDAPWLAAVMSAGFEVELRRPGRRWRAGSRREDWMLGWIRGGLPWATVDSAPKLPTRGERAPIHLRTPLPSDAQAMALLHREDSVMRGTLQTPLRNADTWEKMLGGTVTAAGICAEIEGELVGSGVLMPASNETFQTLAIGLSVTTARQGCGVGSALMRALLDVGRNDLGANRIELEVDTQNEAAHGLYLRCGFVDEGIRRMGSWRGDGYSSATYMGRVYEVST